MPTKKKKCPFCKAESGGVWLQNGFVKCNNCKKASYVMKWYGKNDTD